VESGDPDRPIREPEKNCDISVTFLCQTAPPGAISLLWIVVNKWISASRAEKLREIQRRCGINESAGMSRPVMKAREPLDAAALASPAVSRGARKQLCIVARHPLVSGVFVAGLTTAVGLRDELEVIVDRRGDGPTTVQPPLERRHREHVPRALERDGFAVVPIESTDTSSSSSPGRDRSSLERLADETDLRKLERILWSKHARIIRLSRWLILSVLMNAILALLFVAPAMTARWSQARPMGSRPSTAAPRENGAASVPPSPAPTPDQQQR